MAVIKNKATERNREFWSHVESIAKQVRCDTDITPVDTSASDRSHINAEHDSMKNRTVPHRAQDDK